MSRVRKQLAKPYKTRKLGTTEGHQLGKWLNRTYNAEGLERDAVARDEAAAKRTATKEVASGSTEIAEATG